MLTDKEYLGYTIRCLREYRNLSLEGLKELTEISKSSLSNVELGKNTPSAVNFEKICQALGVTSEFMNTLLKKVRNYSVHSSSADIFKNLDTLIEDSIRNFETGISSDVQSKEFDKPDNFSNAQDAVQFILNQPVIGNYGNFNINQLSDEDKINFANDLLNMIKMISPKYKK